MTENTALTIPPFSKDDYFNSSAPFEWLYQFKDNKFVLNQMCQKMRVAAGAVGVRSFMTLWNAYLESEQAKRGIQTNSATDWESQPMELICGEYICNDAVGVALTDKFGYVNVICRHPIMPVRRLVNVDNGEERLELAYKKGKGWRSTIAEKSMLASSTQILQLAAYGVMVNSDNAKALSTYLLDMEQLNYETIPEQKSVGRLGWIMGNSFSPYVDDLVFDGEVNFRHIFGAVQSNGSFEAWVEAMKKLRAEKTAGRLFLAASFASVLLEPCGLLPFFLHAWGGTETGKTVGLMIAASVWACPKMGEYITTFNSTSVGQEMTASFLNSLPMCIDELQIQSAQGIKDFDKTIYQLTEGVGRTRGAKTGGLQKQTTWKNCIITNGEHPISNANSGGGAINRIIEFECAEKVYSDLVGLCAVINENYGHAGQRFIEILQSGNLFDYANSLQKEYFRKLLESDSTDKQAASASAILAADDMITQMFFMDGNQLTVEDLTAIMSSKNEVNVNVRALDYVYDLVGRNPLRFKADSFGEYRGEVWGKVDNGKIYIVKSVFDREMQSAGFNGTSFLAWAKRNDLIECSSNRRTKMVRIAGSLVNAICLKDNESRISFDWIKDIEKGYDSIQFDGDF